MANRAACTSLGGGKPQTLRDPLRARVEQDGKRFGMKVFLAPGKILAALWSRPAVAARRFAADRSDERPAALLDLARLPGAQHRRDRQDKNADRDGSQRHRARVASAFWKMRLQNRPRTRPSRKRKPPPDFSSGARLASDRAYFAQQPRLSGQQLPPPQQAAEREVALAVPTSAKAARIVSRYFIESSC